MPRSSGQSDFVVRRDQPAPDPDATPAASEAATKWVLRLTVVMLVLLALLLLIGPHIPSGE